MADLLIAGATLVADDGEIPDAWLAVADGRVAALGQGEPPAELAAAEVVAVDGGYLAAGFVDIHGHGGRGVSYDAALDIAELARAVNFHASHGATSQVLSLVSAPVAVLANQLALIADLADVDSRVVGAHLEGPFLADSHRGAHDPAALRAPTPAMVDDLVAAGRGRLRQITIAPDVPGALAAIERFAAAGVVPAVGHTGASRELAAEAFDAGARVMTHAFNAMPGLHHRAPGPVLAALEDPRVVLEVILDGTHVDPGMVALLLGAAPGRVAFVTDAMAATGYPDGDYLLGPLAVRVTDGVARLRDGGAIAGSTLTLDAAVRRAVTECGLTVSEAVAAATAIPARAVAIAGRGRIALGARADLVLLDRGLNVAAVWFAGARQGGQD